MTPVGVESHSCSLGVLEKTQWLRGDSWKSPRKVIDPFALINTNSNALYDLQSTFVYMVLLSLTVALSWSG